MPSADLIARHREALDVYSAAVAFLTPLLEEMAVAEVRDVLPAANQIQVLGEMNEDWAWRLRIQRVLDAKGNVQFDTHLLYFPGLFILLTVLCINFVGDGLRDALDPQSGRD